MIRAWLVAALLGTGCGSLLGIEDLGQSGGGDGGVDTPMPPGMLRFSGTAELFDGTSKPATTADVGIFDGTNVLANGTVDGGGRFSITWMQRTPPVEVVLVAALPGSLQTIHYRTLQFPEMPPLADEEFQITIFNDQGANRMAGLAGRVQSPDLGFVKVRVLDPEGGPLGGATVTTPQGEVVYAGPDGLPSANDVTITDPVSATVWIFNAANPLEVVVTPPEGFPAQGFGFFLDVPPQSFSAIPVQVSPP